MTTQAVKFLRKLRMRQLALGRRHHTPGDSLKMVSPQKYQTKTGLVPLKDKNGNILLDKDGDAIYWQYPPPPNKKSKEPAKVIAASS